MTFFTYCPWCNMETFREAEPVKGGLHFECKCGGTFTCSPDLTDSTTVKDGRAKPK